MKVRHNKIRADINEIEDKNQTKWTNYQVGWPKKRQNPQITKIRNERKNINTNTQK